jgi:acetyl-CoA C-acetyltransferase
LISLSNGSVRKSQATSLASDPSKANGKLAQDYRVQDQADARQLPVPRIAENYAGAAVIESFTVIYGRDGAPTHATVIGRTPANERVLARVPSADKAAIARLLDSGTSPVGLKGRVAQGEDALMVWKF